MTLVCIARTSKQIQLKLTIIVRTHVEQVSLVELFDESESHLKGGHLMLNPSNGSGNGGGGNATIAADERSPGEVNRFSASRNRSNEEEKSYFVVVPLDLSPKRQPVCIRLRIYCEAITVSEAAAAAGNEHAGVDSRARPLAPTCDGQQRIVVRRVYERYVEVPKFSTFVLAPEQCHANDSATGGAGLLDTMLAAEAHSSTARKRAAGLRMSLKLNDVNQLAKVSPRVW